jgi:hypothetical protein
MAETQGGSSEDHGDIEEELLSGESGAVASTLRTVSTSKLRSAAINAAALRIRSGLCVIPEVTADQLRDARREVVLRAILRMSSKSNDESQMMAIAIEHAVT